MRMKRNCRYGFTLVELLVVIGIIAILISVLLPALSKARQSAYAIKCASNLRSVGQAIQMYVAENMGTFPAAYLYVGHSVQNGVQTPNSASNGYIHWTAYMFKGGLPTDQKTYLTTKGWEIFQCPSLEGGGLPPTDTYGNGFPNKDAGSNLEQGQSNQYPVIDLQAPRCAYTVNEAIMPRNKFVKGFQSEGDPSVLRPYRFVRSSQIAKPGNVILATEFNADWTVVSGQAGDNGFQACKSHQPVHGFRSAIAAGGGGTSEYTIYAVPAGGGIGRNSASGTGFHIVRVKPSDLNPHPSASTITSSHTTLDRVGRNHGSTRNPMCNFLYVDGHAETKPLEDTLGDGLKFQWGETFYSLRDSGDVEYQYVQ